jgi:flagellar motor switch protein FliN/FliY
MSNAETDKTKTPMTSTNSLAPEALDANSVLQRAESTLDEVESTLRNSKINRYRLEELIGEGGPPEKVSMDLLRDVTLDLKIELGRTRLNLEEILQLRCGSVVTLDKLAGDPVDIIVNGRLVARGEVLVLNDNFCVRVAELIGSNALT